MNIQLLKQEIKQTIERTIILKQSCEILKCNAYRYFKFYELRTYELRKGFSWVIQLFLDIYLSLLYEIYWLLVSGDFKVLFICIDRHGNRCDFLILLFSLRIIIDAPVVAFSHSLTVHYKHRVFIRIDANEQRNIYPKVVGEIFRCMRIIILVFDKLYRYKHREVFIQATYLPRYMYIIFM